MLDANELERMARERPDDCFLKGSGVLKLTAAVRQLEAEVARLTRGQKALGEAIHNMTVAQQSAWIEWKHGRGADAGMVWIHNGLAGPGFIPDEDAPYGKEAQAWYDANNANPLPACHCGRPSNIAWLGHGACSEAHYREAKASEAAAAAGALVCQACAGDAPGGKCQTRGCFGGPVVEEVASGVALPDAATARGVAWARRQAIEHLRTISADLRRDDNERHGAALVADEIRNAGVKEGDDAQR